VPLAVGFVSVLDAGVVSVAVPSIQSDLGASAADVQWVVAGYALMVGLALIPAGRAGDVLGRRRMFVVGLVAFVVCSAGAGLAPNPSTLVAARLGQGLAAGVLAPQNSALIVQLFADGERGRAFGAFGAATAVSMGLGPVVGGLVLALAGDVGGWRWIFLGNALIGAGVLLMAGWLVPRDRGLSRTGGVDVTGAALLGGVMLCVLFPLAEAEAGGQWLLLAAPVVAAAFVTWERRVVRLRGEPLVDLGLLVRIPGYLSGVLVGAAYFFGFSGVWLVFSLFFQLGLGHSALQSGLAVTVRRRRGRVGDRRWAVRREAGLATRGRGAGAGVGRVGGDDRRAAGGPARGGRVDHRRAAVRRRARGWMCGSDQHGDDPAPRSAAVRRVRGWRAADRAATGGCDRRRRGCRGVLRGARHRGGHRCGVRPSGSEWRS
jgi:MFS family permease